MLMYPKKIKFSVLLLLVTIGVLFALTVGGIIFARERRNVVFNGDFENGDLNEWEAELVERPKDKKFTKPGKEYCCQHSIQIVNSPVRQGKHAVKFTLNKNDPDTSKSRRTELRLGAVPVNSERWYGFSVFIPGDYQKDPSEEIIAQWLPRPDLHLGEKWTGRGPAFSVRIENDRFILDNRWDSRAISTKQVNNQEWNLGKVAKGKWTDWVVRAKWSYKSDGLLEVWKDGQLVLKKNGPNSYNDAAGPFQKIGIYKWEWKYNPRKSTTDQRVIYFDEVRVGDIGASYNDVVP